MQRAPGPVQDEEPSHREAVGQFLSERTGLELERPAKMLKIVGIGCAALVCLFLFCIILGALVGK